MIGFYAAGAMGQGGSRLWTPNDLPVAPVVRLDHISGLTDASGYASAWTNTGSSGGSFTQVTAGRRPQIMATELNGKRVLRFDEDYMLMPSSDAFRNVPFAGLLVVYRKRLTDGTYSERPVVLFGRGTTPEAARVGLFSARGAANQPQFGGRNADAVSFDLVQHIGAVSGAWTVAWGANDYIARTISLSINGAAATVKMSAWSSSVNTSDTSGLNNTIGAYIPIGTGAPGGYSDLDLAAIVGLSSAPTLADVQRLQGYYCSSGVFDLASNLPSDHPFRHVPPYVSTPVLQPSFGSDPTVFGFVADTDSGSVGVAAGTAVATEFGTLLNSEPVLTGGQGITVVSDGADITVRLDGLTPAATPAQAVVLDHKGATIATALLTDMTGYYEGAAPGEFVDGGVYYVRVEAA